METKTETNEEIIKRMHPNVHPVNISIAIRELMAEARKSEHAKFQKIGNIAISEEDLKKRGYFKKSELLEKVLHFKKVRTPAYFIIYRLEEWLEGD